MKLSTSKPLLALAIALILLGGGYVGLNASIWSMSTHRLPSMQDSVRTSTSSGGHRTSRIQLVHSDLLTYNASERLNVQRLVGNVSFRHGNATMTCDSAFLNETDQTFEAFGNVHMIQGDSVHIWARELYYDGRTRLAKLRYQVKLENSTTTIFTDSLDYDRIADMAYYFNGGQIIDPQNTLSSDYGQYYPKTNDAEFRYNVRLVNDSTTMTTEHLYYNTQSRIGRYEGTTHITSDSGSIVSTRGVYDLTKDIGILLDRSEVYSGAKLLIGDSIYYDGYAKFGEAFGRMELHDTTQRASLYGDYGYYDDRRNYAFTTSRAYAVEYSQSDTLFVGADTLELISFRRDPLADTARIGLPADTAERDSLDRHLRAYRNVRVYRIDGQSVADSMTYSGVDSILTLYGKPIMWSQKRQIAGDTIIFYFKEKKLNYSDVLGNVFAIEQTEDRPEYYNQIKSAKIRAYMQDSTIRQIDATGGSVESVFYMKDEKANRYTGMNRMTSSAMHATLDSGRPQKVLWLGAVAGKTYPIAMAEQGGANRLDGFAWAEERRPKRPEDVVSADSTASTSLTDLKRFSGAKAALAIYEPFDQRFQERQRQADSIRAAIHEAAQKAPRYIMRQDDSTAIDPSAPYLSLQWLYNPFSDPESPEASTINTSTGMLVRRHSPVESRGSAMNSSTVERSRERKLTNTMNPK